MHLGESGKEFKRVVILPPCDRPCRRTDHHVIPQPFDGIAVARLALGLLGAFDVLEEFLQGLSARRLLKANSTTCEENRLQLGTIKISGTKPSRPLNFVTNMVYSESVYPRGGVVRLERPMGQ